MTASLSLDPAAFEKNLIRVVVMTKRASDQVSRMPFKVPTAGFAAAMKAIRGMAAAMSSFGKGGLSGIGASFLVGGWTGIGGAIAGIGRQMVQGTAGAYDYGREMMNFSRATGVAKEKSADFALALHDSQLTTNELVVAMRLMSEQMLRAAEGDKQAVHRFNQLNLSYRELLHLPMEQAFMRVGKALANTANPALRSAAAIRMFGDTGAKTLKLFERGGALEMAREALGGQSGIIGRNGEAFEKISIRLSHIGVKLRGLFVGIAEATMPMVEKFTDLFHKVDLTAWGKRLGDAVNDAMAWVVTFWKEPGKTMNVFWAAVKLKTIEFGIWLHDAIESAFPGMGDRIQGWIKQSIEWGRYLIGMATDFITTMAAGLTWAFEQSGRVLAAILAPLFKVMEFAGKDEVAQHRQAVEGINAAEDEERKRHRAAVLENAKGADSREAYDEEKLRHTRMLQSFGRQRQERLDAISKLGGQTRSEQMTDLFNKPTSSFAEVLAATRGKVTGGGGAGPSSPAFAVGGWVDKITKAIERGMVLASAKAGVAMAKAAVAPAMANARAALGQGIGVGPQADAHVQAFRNSAAWRFGGRPSAFGEGFGFSTLMGASNAGGLDARSSLTPLTSLSGMHAGPYDRSNLLRHRELRGFRNARIAARMGRILASGKRDISDAEYVAGGGDYSDRRRPGETANGDRQRAKAFAKEIARREAAQGTDNQLLGDIARNTAESKNIMAEAFK